MKAVAQLVVVISMGYVALAADYERVAREAFNGRPTPARRTVQQKVNASGLIVFGTASAFGGTSPPLIHSGFESCNRNLRVSIAAVLWPRTFTNTCDIVFPYSFLPSHPRSWWDYSNTAGIFFLATNSFSQSRWDKIYHYDDWFEPSANLLGGLTCIQNEKGELSFTGLLDISMPTLQQISRFESTEAASNYQLAFREGYLAALAGNHGFWVFAPTNQQDKVKVFGYADGQSAGDIAWSAWLRKHLVQ